MENSIKVDSLELIAFDIISKVGTARSSYIEAIQMAKEAKFDEAMKLIDEGDEMFVEGHRVHSQLLTFEAERGQGSAVSLLILHAEDQLMSAEGFKAIALEFVDLYKRLETIEKIEHIEHADK